MPNNYFLVKFENVDGPAHSEHLIPVRVDSCRRIKEILKQHGKCHRIKVELINLISSFERTKFNQGSDTSL